MKYLIYTGILFFFTACSDYPEGLRESLRMAGKNSSELEKALAHYSRHPADSLKYQAACFLVENMKWHGNSTVLEYPDSGIAGWVLKADSLLFSFSAPGESWDKIRAKVREHAPAFQEAMNSRPVSPPTVRKIPWGDVRNISATFLITHIEHSFERWNNSPYAKNLSFPDFCEKILPCRSVMGNSLLSNAKTTYEQVGKHLKTDSLLSLRKVVDNYNFYLSQMRALLGKKPCKEYLGYYEIFFNKKFECDEQCEAECNILRACGIPMAVDINVGNREFVGQHFHCVAFDSLNIPDPFNGETPLNTFGYNAKIKLNIYRCMFGAQKDSPFFLKKKKEQLPANFKTPCLKEVTRTLKNVYPLDLPLSRKVKNRLVWLYSYANNERGVKAATWGIVDSDKKTARFTDVVPDMLYFPCLINEKGEPEFFQEPFHAKRMTEKREIAMIPLQKYFDSETPDSVNLLITRKFPYKEGMKTLANEMVGGTFYGASTEDGSGKKELYTITEPPGPYLNEYRFNNHKAWKYYIYQAPENREAHISILEFLTESSRNCSNTKPATPLEIFKPEDITRNETEWVKLSPDTSGSRSWINTIRRLIPVL